MGTNGVQRLIEQEFSDFTTKSQRTQRQKETLISSLCTLCLCESSSFRLLNFSRERQEPVSPGERAAAHPPEHRPRRGARHRHPQPPRLDEHPVPAVHRLEREES